MIGGERGILRKTIAERMGFETHNDLRVMNPAPIEKVRFVTATGFQAQTLKLQLDLDWIQTSNP